MPTINRRAWLAGSAALACAGPARAQAYPQRPVRIIVPYAAGGGTDAFARLLGANIQGEFGQSFIVDNRGGGASIPGTQAIATAPPDGYTIGMVDSAFVTNPGMFKDKLPYDTRKDFAPVSLLVRNQLLLVVPTESQFKTAAELVAFGKANPDRLTFASAGIGTAIHLAGEQLRQIGQMPFIMVPYRGGAPALADLISGKIDFAFSAYPSIRTHLLGGKVRALAVAGPRIPQAPELASLAEFGLGGVDAATEIGMVAPAATPPEVIVKLNQLSSAAVKGGMRERLIEIGSSPIGSTPAEFRAHIDREIVKWEKLIAVANLKPE
jgi:tripartite-type tricarboxylate transporter receptor subunit TctC